GDCRVQPCARRDTRLPYTTLFRSKRMRAAMRSRGNPVQKSPGMILANAPLRLYPPVLTGPGCAEGRGAAAFSLQGMPDTLSSARSEEHTPELQSRGKLVCRLLLEQ